MAIPPAVTANGSADLTSDENTSDEEEVKVGSGVAVTDTTSGPEKPRKQTAPTIDEIIARIPTDSDDAWTESSSSDGDDDGDEDSERYEPPTTGKLRALARVVMINLRWAKDNRRGDDYNGFETKCKDRVTGQWKSVFFKVTDFLANKRIISGLTAAEKKSLKVHPIGRTKEDIEGIMKVLDRYKCFEKFTLPVREKLAVWVRYDTFDDSRVLLRQGHEPWAMFFILQGTVNFKASDTDPRTGRTNHYPLGVRGPSSIIGEIELLNNDERRSTGIIQSDVELLRVDEEPFNEVLRASFEAIWDDRFAILRSAQIFHSWTDAELRILNENSSVISFNENKSILSDVSGPSAFTYIIQKGRCAMVKDVIFERFYFGPAKTIMYQSLEPEDDTDTDTGTDTGTAKGTGTGTGTDIGTDIDPGTDIDTVTDTRLSYKALRESTDLEGHHLNITEFKEGDYFGVGEDLRRCHIIALGMVECLTIPRSVFEKANRMQFLEDLKADLEDAIPTDEQILEEWLALQTWKSYRRSHLKQFYGKRKAEQSARFFNMYKRNR
ncbi:hypothetical protein BV898_17654 [Hypsibius exemplaris]|uniref:Cyclic nucleotide-binding domain-containing protein n=1 Tax=Hypsibius exemplaris TaxID=2072580 RepID=A0A9X6NIE8_HYPEX|nr:hypothetical protein BV898_17654 [Hypsibius exemplaris]